MTIAIAGEEEKAAYIQRSSAPGYRTFNCPGKKHLFYKFYLLQDQPDNDMRYWLGYNKELDAFFITDTQSRVTEHLLLQMEYNRLFQEKKIQTHQVAVRNALKAAPKDFRAEMVAFLRTFYQEWADKLEPLDENERTEDQKDIIATAEFLKNLQG